MSDFNIELGSQIRAIAETLGMSEDQALQMVMTGKKRGEKRLGRELDVNQVGMQFLQKLQKVQALNQETPERIDDLITIPNSQVDYGEFGNQDELQNFGGVGEGGRIKNADEAQREIERARGKRDPNLLSRTYFEKGKEGPQTEEIYVTDGMPVPKRFREAAKNRDFGIYREDVPAPAAQVQRIERDALQQGVDQFGADAFPGAVDVIGRINDDIQGNRDAEQSLVREMVARDRQRQNSEVVEANNWRAQAAANVIGQDFAVGGRGARADQAVANIGQIAQLGPAKIAYDFQVSRNPVDRGTAIPGSLPLNLPDQYNAPVTDNRYAGPLQRQEQWLVDAMPGYKETGAFGRFDNVSINEQMGIARAAIQNAKINKQSVDLGDMQIRNIADLQAAADQVVELARQQGVSFFNNVDGKNVFNPNPGIGEVLERGGLNARQIGDVAKAGYAVDAAMKNPVNQVAKNFYSVGMGQPSRDVEFGGFHPALGEGAVQIDMLNREKVEGREVKGQLQRLQGKRGNPGEPLNKQELDLARMPFQAGVAGEGVKRARFVRGRDTGLSEDAIYEKYGPVNGQIANAVIQRYEQSRGINSDGFGVRVERQRNMDPGTESGGAGNGGMKPPTAVAAFDPGPDPWSEPVGQGNGINQEIVKRAATKPAQAPRPGAYSTDPGIKPDGPSIRQPNPKQVRAEADYRKMRRYGRNAAIAGGAALGLAGIGGLINGERNRRDQEAQY